MEFRDCDGTILGTMTPGVKHQYKPGELFIYVNGDRFEIGKVKRVVDGGVFAWYHFGETAAKTPFECMHPLANQHCVLVTMLGLDPDLNPDILRLFNESATGPGNELAVEANLSGDPAMYKVCSDSDFVIAEFTHKSDARLYVALYNTLSGCVS